MLHAITRLLTTKRIGSASGSRRPNRRGRRLRAEFLEPRIALAASGLVEIGQQPDGGLTGKIAYLHPGHGYENQDGSWDFQRSEQPGTEMIEDLGTQDQMNFLADYLFRAGATIVPLRPIGHQTNEVILDNDSPGVSFSGTWSNSNSPVFYGSAGDIRYRFASTSLTETAFARYRPNIPEEGFYPVYAWTRSGLDRAVDQLYRVTHSGGTTEVTINHRRVGNGLVYLGTYHFEAGTNGYVDISNRSSNAGNVVIADMIRFGNGIGESGLPREDEAGLYWIERHAAPPYAQGISPGEYGTSVVTAAPRYAEFMNREVDGSLSDRVFISYHSNAGGGRGVTALHNTQHGGDTPNQVLLAQRLAQEVNNDLVAQNGVLDPDWHNRGTNVLYQNPSFNYGEINNFYINNEFDATIVEVAFHDSTLDAALMRESYAREAVARATYQGLIKYFRAVDGNSTPATELPSAVTNVRAESNAEGSVTLSWATPTSNSYLGGAATGYRIYASTNGYGFDGGTFVSGGGTTSTTLNGYDPTIPYYFKIVAVNAGGESVGSEVLTVLPSGGQKQVLVVNGFDRLDRAMNPRQSLPAPNNTIDRVRPRESNSYDYTAQVGQAIHAAMPGAHVNSTSNEAVISGAVNLGDYEAVIWILGEESTGDDTFNATEQSKVTAYLNAGGKLFVTGSEIGWDLDSQGNGQSFYNNALRADYVADDANTYSATGVADSIFSGLNVQFDNGSQFYDAEFPDRISPLNGSTAAFNYSGGTGGTAAIQYSGANGQKLVMFGFPFETITSANLRRDVMGRVLEFFEIDTGPIANIEYILDNDHLAPTYTETGTWSLSANPGYEGGTYKFATVGNPSQATWSTFVPIEGQAEVFVIYTTGVGRPTNATYTIDTGNGVENASVNQTINNLQWVSLGTFDFAAGTRSVTLDAETSSGGSFVIADAVRIVLTGQPVGVGDFNSDGFVNGKDYFVWLANAGTTEGATLQMGDGNFDGRIDRADLAIWQAQFGLVGPPPGSGSGAVAEASAASAPAVSESLAESALPPSDATGRATSSATLPRGSSTARSESARNEERTHRRLQLLATIDAAFASREESNTTSRPFDGRPQKREAITFEFDQLRLFEEVFDDLENQLFSH